MTDISLAARIGTLPAGDRLRLVLRVDAVATLALAVLVAAGAGVLDGWLGLGRGVLLGIGAFLLVWAGFVWEVSGVAMRPARPVDVRLARVVAAGNAAWVVASLVVVVAGPLTALGVAVALVQAVVVAVVAALQLAAARR